MAWHFDTKIGKFVDNLSRHIVNNNWILNEGVIDGFSTFLTAKRGNFHTSATNGTNVKLGPMIYVDNRNL